MSQKSAEPLLPAKRPRLTTPDPKDDGEIKIIGLADEKQKQATAHGSHADLDTEFQLFEAEIVGEKKQSINDDEVDEEEELAFQDAKEEQEQKELVSRVERLKQKFKERLEKRKVDKLVPDYLSSTDDDDDKSAGDGDNNKR